MNEPRHARLTKTGFKNKVKQEADNIHEILQHYKDILPSEQFVDFLVAVLHRVEKKLKT